MPPQSIKGSAGDSFMCEEKEVFRNQEKVTAIVSRNRWTKKKSLGLHFASRREMTERDNSMGKKRNKAKGKSLFVCPSVVGKKRTRATRISPAEKGKKNFASE